VAAALPPTIPPPMITIGFCLLSRARRDILLGVKASAYGVFGEATSRPIMDRGQ
jgi:hypothetical protein